MAQELNFRACTLLKLDKSFGLKQVRSIPALSNWLDRPAELSDLEEQVLRKFRELLIRNVHDWNEAELAHHFIGPVFSLVEYTTDWFNLFAERSFAGTVEGVTLRGKPDGMIASGLREPETPYFCFQEYKKEQDPEGDPAAQALAAMLVAQTLNEQTFPIYGCYVKGSQWYFMALSGQQYAISPPYVAIRDDLFDIFRILKGLKQILLERATS